ncbi:MAG TPA: hypothetical protein VK894_11285 [Jiangellales bacterium]|nr:hypothetical protein [Jiangellales bacterium]
MLFSAESWPGLADGSITRTFRRWRRAQVREGGRYRVAGLLLEVDAVCRVRVGDLTEADAAPAGEPSRDALLARLAGRGEVPGPDEQVWRVDLHCVGPDDRIALREAEDLAPDDVESLRARLDRLDRASSYGPWTRAVLRQVARQPGVVSTVLAAEAGRERQSYKADVRKLKGLGLTESLQVGYRLSPRGAALLAALENG